MKNSLHIPFRRMVFLLFFVIAGGQMILAQTGSVKGTISDESGISLPGVNVLVEGTEIGTATDIDGKYMLENVPVGEQSVTVSYVGYSNNTKTVNVTEGETTELTFTLSESAMALEEITVTATRRTTDVQTTAAAISAISGKQLEVKGVVNVNAFLDEIPGVTLSDGGGDNKVIMRNIATSTQETGNATIATYFDDFALSGPSGMAEKIRLVDIDRIEVLKGPQGTLFGRSAMGGIIRYISNKPDTKKFKAGVNTYLSNTTDGGMNYGGHAFVNVPILSNLAIRAVAYTYQNSGFIDNIELDKPNFNNDNTLGGRIALHWDATDALSLDLTYFNQSADEASGRVTTTRDPGDLNVAGDEGEDIPFDVEARTMIGGTLDGRDVNNQYLNMKLEYDFKAFTATFLGTRGNRTQQFMFDQRGYVGVTWGSLYDVQDSKSTSNLAELRLVSSGDDNLFDWIAGAYYEDTENSGTQFINYLGPDGGLLLGFYPLYEGMDPAIDQNWLKNGAEKAVYGELGLNLGEKSRVLVGYRYSDVSHDNIITKADGFFDAWQGVTLIVDSLFAVQENVHTFKASLEHKFNKDIFGYALASSGYRHGGWNRPTATSPFSTYDSDKLLNYELGFKTTWLNGRLRANIAAYLLNYTDIQLNVQDPVTFVRATKNVGKANIMGTEFDIHYMPIDNLIFGFSGSLSNPKLTEDVPPSIIDPEGDPNDPANLIYTGRKGDKLPGSSTESFAFSVNYNKSFNENLGGFAYASYKYVGDRLNDFNLELDDYVLPAYSMVNLRIGVSHSSGLTVSLFADNLLDEAAVYYIQRSTGLYDQVPTSRPRTVGINLSYNFN